MSPEGSENWRDNRQQSHQSDRDWGEYRRLILSELERLNDSILALGVRLDSDYDKYQIELSKIKVELAQLQIKSSLWGAVAAVIVTFGVVLLRYMVGVG